MDSKDDDKPFLLVGTGSETVAPGLHMLRGQGQSFVAETDAGLVVVDAGPGGSVTQGMIDSLRALSDAPVHALCYSHGHIGYNAGVPQWLEHARQRGEPAPRLIAHRNVLRRHARYRETEALQHRMAEVQFNRSPGFFERRLAMHEPTETFDQRLVIGSGEQRIELLWAPSETDDAIALWSPAQRVIYGGAALLDSIPNIGTPFRTLRDTVRWAGTLEALAALDPRIAVREFGPLIEGEAEVQKVLTHTARALRWLRAEVVSLMNQGLGEQQVLARMHYPEELFGVPWMKPTYGDPSYIVRDIYRSENGWWDRNPTTLHPEPPEAVGAAVARAITDKPAVIASAQALADAGQWQLALHVIDLLATAHGDAPELAQARALKAAWLRERAAQVASYVSRNLYKVSADMIEQGTQGRFGIR
ncbi:alkyl sulfatase dimerization domain-containing protein [Comamonas testosteroni]|uniref:Metallo-beta-lactamase superfamily n=1 Tax=Comamonas testosteroni TaxID=285 RepID=A0A8B4S8W3_COMTE|nr:alkyl sulfatase dimerization domain-containing protein [Comamonas testosteroni]EHN63194.1 beta-lactamase domain-containing protein [Comamonas testosteroni ATCC 11996]QQN71661.1 MBL fold metallo-hydrolase [Comamonas testosteroni]SUY79684.1 Metallo-beta-lactamase superfamily [Comamonas testosteroni]